MCPYPWLESSVSLDTASELAVLLEGKPQATALAPSLAGPINKDLFPVHLLRSQERISLIISVTAASSVLLADK